MKLAHFSDIHVTLPPLNGGGPLFGKRLAGLASYYVGGRGHHFHGVETRIARLLEDVDRAQPDHVLCTGDLTQMSFPAEFNRAEALFGSRLSEPSRFTVIPGNHDRYTVASVRAGLFERGFGGLACTEGRYPCLKWLEARDVALVLVDVTRPTSLVDSSGWCGPEQRIRLLEMLTDTSLRSAFVIVGLHYGLLLPDGRRDRVYHRIRDDLELMEVIDHADAHLDLVLHGHMHQTYVVSTKRRVVVCAGSATDLVRGGGWNLLDIDVGARNFGLSRRVWSQSAQDYLPSSEPIPGWPLPERTSGHPARTSAQPK